MKKTPAIAIISALLIILAMLTIGCSGDKNAGNNTNNASAPKVESDPFYTQGFTKATIPSYEFMYDDLLDSVSSAVDMMSSSSITAASPYCSVLVGMDVALNNAKYNVKFNLGYDKSAGESLIWSINVCDAATGERVGDCACFDSETAETTNVYIALGDRTCKIPFAKNIIAKGFPITLDSELSAWFNSVFNSVISPKEGSTKYEYKLVSGKATRHYAFEIDILKTLRQLYSMASVFQYDTKSIDFILSSILGITKTSVEQGNIPGSVIAFEFTVCNCYQNQAGGGTLTSAHAVMDIEANDSYKYTIFEGEDCRIVLDIDDIEVSESRNITTPKEADFIAYKSYNAQTFNMNFGVVFREEPDVNYAAEVSFLYDAEDNSQTEIHCNINNEQTGEKRFSFDYENENANVYLKGEELSVKFDFQKLVELSNKQLVEFESPNIVMTIAYLAGSFKIMNYRLSVGMNNESFKEVTGFTPECIMNILEQCTPNDFNLKQYLLRNEIDMQEVIGTEFTIQIYLNDDNTIE